MKNVIYAQSGGVTSVINASASGVISACRKHGEHIDNLYAAQNGILGVLNEDLIDTSKESADDIDALKHTPGGAFGSCRYKLKSLKDNQAEYTRIIEVCKAHEVRYFFYNGGNDSADTCLKIAQVAKELNYPLQAIHIPKTIDNDLVVTDNCPGFGSVAKYVATSTLEAGIDLGSMCLTSTKVFILEVMGRHAGWIAASAALARNGAFNSPHIILLPEVTFNQEKFLAKVKQVVEEVGFCVIVASEGIKDNSGELLSSSGSFDAFGHAQLGGVAPLLAQIIKQNLGYKYHWGVSDYLQRSARHLASKIDVAQAYRLGQSAVEFAIAGKSGIMPYIKRVSSDPYIWEIDSVELTQVANLEKHLPQDFISADGFDVTSKCIEYLKPLIEGEDYPPFKAGIPNYVTLQNLKIAKKLAPWNK